MRRPARLGRAALALALLAAPGAAWAERAVVRTGEHEGFTRLVLGFESLPRFALSPIPGGWRLDPRREGTTYDLSDVWRRIGRERVLALEPGPGGALDIRLACDCGATAFAVGEAMVVVDVADPDPDRPAPRAPVALPPVALPSVLVSGLPLVSPATPKPAPEPAIAEPAPPPPPPAPEAPDLAAFGADLARQLQEGVDRGLLEPAAPLVAGEPARGGALRLGLPSDLGAAVAVGADPRAAEAAACPGEGVSALLPGGGEAAPGGVAEARGALFGEFDRVDPEAARRLVGALLAVGLGAEAREALRLASMPEAEAEALRAVARLVDGDAPLAGAAAVEPWALCGGRAALWAVLSLEGRPLPRALDRGGVVGAFSEMALPLRVHLAPRLAGAFLADGDVATARLVRNAALRAGGEPDRAMRLLGIRLDLAADGALDEALDAAAEALAALARGSDEVALEAAALLLGEMADGALPEGALEDAAVLVAERRGGAAGERLRGLLAGALMDRARWDEALALAREAPAGAPDTPALWEAVARRLAEEAAAPTFLRLAYAEGAALAAAPLSSEAAGAIAARREALGYGPASAAARWAAPEPPGAAAAPEDPTAAPEVAAAPAPIEGAPILEATPPADAALNGPLASGQQSLEESRRRRAELAARLEALDAVAGGAVLPGGAAGPPASTLR